MYHYVRYCGLVLLIWCLDWAADSLTMYSLVQCDSLCDVSTWNLKGGTRESLAGSVRKRVGSRD